MFTGIIEELAEVANFTRKQDSARIQIRASHILETVKNGDSIAVNGICLTVTHIVSGCFSADISNETIKVTSAASFTRGTKVNLERAMQLGGRLSGHLVSGHVDTVGTIADRRDSSGSAVLSVSFDPSFGKYIIPKGSIAIDGISLTVNDVRSDTFRVDIIPHSLQNTTIQYMRKGDKVNLEFDIIGKYIEKISRAYTGGNSSIDENLLANAGFLKGRYK